MPQSTPPRSQPASTPFTLEPPTVTVLLDNGATGMFINQEFVRHNNLETCPLPEAIPVYNVDGATNRNGSIHKVYEAILEIGTHSE